MQFSLQFTAVAADALAELGQFDFKKHHKVLKTLALMESNIRHPGLKTHKYNSLSGSNGEEVFEAYVENTTPAAFRIFWYYDPNPGIITILAIAVLVDS
jgi:hypothetical protein